MEWPESELYHSQCLNAGRAFSTGISSIRTAFVRYQPDTRSYFNGYGLAQLLPEDGRQVQTTVHPEKMDAGQLPAGDRLFHKHPDRQTA